MTQYLITALIDFIVASLALSKRNNKAATALAAAAFCFGVWSIELFLLTVVSDVDVLSPWFHLTRSGMFLIPATLALLAWRVTGSQSRLFLRAVLIPGFVVGVALPICNIFFFPSELQAATGGYLPKTDIIYYVFAGLFGYCLSMSMLLCGVSYWVVTMRQKQRIRWLLITLGMTFVTGVLSIILMPYDFYLSKFVGAVTNITFVSLLFYSTVQHHLMDVRLALSESLTRILLLSFFISLYFSVSAITRGLDSTIQGSLFTVLFLVAVLEVYPRLLKWLLPNARKFLSKDGYSFDDVIQDTAKVLHDIVDYKMMRKACDHLFLQVLRLDGYAVLALEELRKRNSKELVYANQLNLLYGGEYGVILADESSEDMRRIFDEYSACAALPLRHGGECVGFLMLGPSSNLSYYRYDDIRIFEWLQVELGQVLNRIKQLDEMQDQLGQAKKTLSMLGVMNHYHHDIKAPFSIIDGVLSNDIYDKEKQKDIVLQQVERGSRLIATMAAILKGGRRRKVQALSLEEVVRDSVFLFSQGIDKIEYRFGAVPDILGDAEDLKILIINIVKNAMEAREVGRSLIMTITTWATRDNIYLSLADTGRGIDTESLDKLWDDNDSSKATGNGIGMQAIKRIADEHNAEVEVVSAVGEGATFTFKFPMNIATTVPKLAAVVDRGASPDLFVANAPDR